MKTVKLSIPTKAMYLARLTPGNACVWGDYRFVINQEIDACDYLVVYNSLINPTETTICPPSHTVFITGEPESVHKYDQRLLDQFAKVVSVQTGIKHPGLVNTLQIMHWALGINRFDLNDNISKDYDELMALKEIKKTKLISIITSNKMGTAGHRLRYHFALKLKKYFGDDIDLFGQGIKDFGDTWEALAPYKYSIPIENSSYDNYATEKLFECYLAHTFPIYHGAPNIGKYLSADSFATININDFNDSVQKIKKIINDPEHYERHLNDVIKAKLKYLQEYSFFPLIVDVLNKLPPDNNSQPIILTNYSKSKTRHPNLLMKYIKKIIKKIILLKY